MLETKVSGAREEQALATEALVAPVLEPGHETSTEKHSQADRDAPDFLGEALEEIRSFFATAWRFTRHPIRFVREWADGNSAAMNPLSFLGAAFGANLAAGAIFDHFFPPIPDPGWGKLANSVAQLAWLAELTWASFIAPLVLVVFAFFFHLPLRRQTTRSFRSTLGAVFFAEGWMQLVLAMVTTLVLVGSAVSGFRWLGGGAVAALEPVILLVAAVGVQRHVRTRSAILAAISGYVGLIASTWLVLTLFISGPRHWINLQHRLRDKAPVTESKPPPLPKRELSMPAKKP